MKTHSKLKPQHQTGTLRSAIKAVIIGDLPPLQTPQTLEAMRLCLSYAAQDTAFQTLTGVGRSQAQIKFSVKSRAKFATARTHIINAVSSAPRTTVFCDMFARPNLQCRKKHHRLWEYTRFMLLFWACLTHANDLSVVLSETRNPLVNILLKLAAWKRGAPIHQLKTQGAGQRLINRAQHPALAPFELKASVQKLHHHSLSNLPDAPPFVPSNLSIYGLANSPTGLGQNARMSAQCFQKLGLEPCMIDTDSLKWHQSQTSPHRLTQPLHLHHMNADRILPPSDAAYNIGYLLWEFQALPNEHISGLNHLDEIWSPSSFVTDIYKPQTDKPVLTMKKGIEPRANITPAPTPDHFTFLNAFDFHSSVERKNPLATAHAFQIAFPPKAYPECRLILKTTPTEPRHWGDPNDQIGQLRGLAAKDARIELIESFCSADDFHQMIANADAIVSTHRTEGFGYIPAYALLYARPVITTHYGGVTDFCTSNTTNLVPAPMVEVPVAHMILKTKGALWADVSPEEVAKQMLWVYANHAAAKVKAHKGKLLMQKEYSIVAQTHRYQNRLAELGLWEQAQNLI